MLWPAGVGLSWVRRAGPGADDAGNLAKPAALVEGERFVRRVQHGGIGAVVHPMPTHRALHPKTTPDPGVGEMVIVEVDGATEDVQRELAWAGMVVDRHC